MTDNCWTACPLICSLSTRIERLEKALDVENVKKWRILWILLGAVLCVAGIKATDAVMQEWFSAPAADIAILHNDNKRK